MKHDQINETEPSILEHIFISYGITEFDVFIQITFANGINNLFLECMILLDWLYTHFQPWEWIQVILCGQPLFPSDTPVKMGK